MSDSEHRDDDVLDTGEILRHVSEASSYSLGS